MTAPINLSPIDTADLDVGDVIATPVGWARVARRTTTKVELRLLPWWSPARAWRTVAERVGLGGWC